MTVARLSLWTAAVHGARRRCLFALAAPQLVAGFTTDVALSAVAMRLLHVAAVFQLFDGAHIVARSILRGVGDVRFAAIVGVVTAWVMTPPLTWLLGWHFGLGAYGGWVGLSAETIIGAALLWRRLRYGHWRVAAAAARSLVRRARNSRSNERAAAAARPWDADRPAHTPAPAHILPSAARPWRPPCARGRCSRCTSHAPPQLHVASPGAAFASRPSSANCSATMPFSQRRLSTRRARCSART